jgi:hypothetical protein
MNAENRKSCCLGFPSAENTLPCPNASSTTDGWLFAPHTCWRYGELTNFAARCEGHSDSEQNRRWEHTQY